MLQAVDLKKWVVMYVDKNADVAKSFQNLMTKVNMVLFRLPVLNIQF